MVSVSQSKFSDLPNNLRSRRSPEPKEDAENANALRRRREWGTRRKRTERTRSWKGKGPAR